MAAAQWLVIGLLTTAAVASPAIDVSSYIIIFDGSDFPLPNYEKNSPP